MSGWFLVYWIRKRFASEQIGLPCLPKLGFSPVWQPASVMNGWPWYESGCLFPVSLTGIFVTRSNATQALHWRFHTSVEIGNIEARWVYRTVYSDSCSTRLPNISLLASAVAQHGHMAGVTLLGFGVLHDIEVRAVGKIRRPPVVGIVRRRKDFVPPAVEDLHGMPAG